ncbi:MAG: hypothetical protein HYZ54_07215 [Ignavibacteriae bacterium]|nr:hypothetical protein [Ignavibacteriota bacterium]
MDDNPSRLLTRIRMSEIKKGDLKILFDAGCSMYTIAKLYKVPMWMISNKCTEFGLHKNYYVKIQLEASTFDITKYKKVFTDLLVRTVLDIGYNYNYPSQSELVRDLGATYSHMTRKILPFLRNYGFIEFVRKGKKEKRIKLTEKGVALFRKFEEIVSLIEAY